MNRRRNIRTQTDKELAEQEAAEQQAQSGMQAREPEPQAFPTASHAPTTPPLQQEEPTYSRAHLVKHRAPRAENAEEQFDSVYKRETYYIDRTYLPRLKKLIEETKRTKTDVMNEALDLLFEKYRIE